MKTDRGMPLASARWGGMRRIAQLDRPLTQLVQPPEIPRDYTPTNTSLGEAVGGAFVAINRIGNDYGMAADATYDNALFSLKDQIERELPDGYEGDVIAEPGAYDTGGLGFGDNRFVEVSVSPSRDRVYAPESQVRIMHVSGKNKSPQARLRYSGAGVNSTTMTNSNGQPTKVKIEHVEGPGLVDWERARELPADARFDRGYRDAIERRSGPVFDDRAFGRRETMVA
jgi:hypothetical protein